MSWIIQEAEKADPRRDRVILENPAAVQELDSLLLDTYYPPIKRKLEDTGYPFSSIGEDGIPIESRWDGPTLGRCLIFMIFDPFSLPVLRGSLIRSRIGYMFEREFFLALPRTTDPSFLFRILSEDAFAGNTPTLTIEPSALHPESGVYYWINIQSGNGIQSGQWTLDQGALGNIEETITTSIEMYESTIKGFETMADVEAFITLASTCFEAS